MTLVAPRLALVLAVTCGLALALVILYRVPPEQNRFAPACLFHQATGLHCPGCGGTRAVHAMLHLRLGEAAKKNLLLMVALPLLAMWGGREAWRWVRGAAPQDPPKMIRPWIVWTIVIAVIAFGVLRNLPWTPFRWLAPQ